MPKKSGRPPKAERGATENKQRIVDAAVRLIRERGADCITVRNVCKEADIGTGTFYYHFQNKDDLMMSFLRETSFARFTLVTPPERIADRMTELYMHLIHRYMELGLDFMKSFYSTGNRSLSAYLGETDGVFPPGTVMARSEAELLSARNLGIVRENTDIHTVCMDICTIVKGCVFEWCLTDGRMDIAAALQRILRGYLREFLLSPAER